MRTIFKTKLDVCDYQTVELPQDYKIIHVDMQQDTPCIWYECTPDMPVEITCAIGDEMVDGHPYSEIVEIARDYIQNIGGFEEFAAWGLIRLK